ncbi:MAG TPA: VWA domain-containing protein [Bacillales bacterium]|nr:VWA domain-containing protein [Bacillales bacterium]
MGLQVANPLWLLALIPVLALLVLHAREKTSITGGRKAVWLTLRGFVFLFMILALAGFQLLWPVKHVSTVFVVDRSHSMLHQQEAMKEAINNAISEKSPEDRAAIVTVGAEPAVERPFTTSPEEVVEFQTSVNRDYTNLADGLTLAGSLFGDHARGRVVLMTDGNENIGSAKKRARYLHAQGYIVDVMPFQVKRGKDVALKKLDVSRTAYLGEKVSLTVTLKSTKNTNSRLRVYEDRRVILDQSVRLKQGINRFSFQHLVQKSGFHTYRAEVLTEGDRVFENNNLYAFSDVKGLPRVLMVEGKPGAARNLAQALKSSAARVDVIQPELLPTQLGGYLNYDSIVFANVAAPDVSGRQMQLIARAVKDFAVGFIMTGGKQSYGLGGYFKTPIERILPVDMELKGKKQIPSLGLMIVLDKSGSMSGRKIALAREAAARSVALLRPRDTLGVIAFDGKPWQVVETGPIKNPKKVAEKIRSIPSGGGTDIFTSLAMAYAQLKPLDLKRKHIILLTDGRSATNMDWVKMIKEGKDGHITLSTVSIGQGAADVLLKRMAKLGGGRFYDVQDVSSIPTIFSRETALLTRTYIVDDPFYPRLVNGYEWRSHFAGGVPKMNAYIATTPKGRAEQILVSQKKDPLLTRWQYGLGKTVAWTSDLSGKWAGDWPAWKNWAPLWNDIVTWTFPQYEQDAYNVTKTIDGNQVTVTIKSADKRTLPTLDARLVNEKGETVGFSLHAKAPGTYEGTFTAKQAGVYYLQLLGKNSRFQTGIVVPYSREYALLAENEDLLKEVAKAGGGKVLKNPEEAFAHNLPPAYQPQDLFYWLLVAALALFLFDVAIRRFQISFAFFGRAFTTYRATREKETKTIRNQSNRMEQLKRASIRRTKPEEPHSSEKRRGRKNGSVPPKTGRQKPRANDVRTEADSGQRNKQHVPQRKPQKTDREERMARLLEAKNKRKRQ